MRIKEQETRLILHEHDDDDDDDDEIRRKPCSAFLLIYILWLRIIFILKYVSQLIYFRSSDNFVDIWLVYRFTFLEAGTLLARSQLQTFVDLIFRVTQKKKELDNTQYLQFTKIIEAFILLRC